MTKLFSVLLVAGLAFTMNTAFADEMAKDGMAKDDMKKDDMKH